MTTKSFLETGFATNSSFCSAHKLRSWPKSSKVRGFWQSQKLKVQHHLQVSQRREEVSTNWWFGARWFGILGVPLSNNSIHKGILGIQTTNPSHQLAIGWKCLEPTNNNKIPSTEQKRKARQRIDSKVPTRRQQSICEFPGSMFFGNKKHVCSLPLMDSSLPPHQKYTDLWWTSHTVLQTSLSWAYAKYCKIILQCPYPYHQDLSLDSSQLAAMSTCFT